MEGLIDFKGILIGIERVSCFWEVELVLCLFVYWIIVRFMGEFFEFFSNMILREMEVFYKYFYSLEIFMSFGV